jgi:hypothetical protein
MRIVELSSRDVRAGDANNGQLDRMISVPKNDRCTSQQLFPSESSFCRPNVPWCKLQRGPRVHAAQRRAGCSDSRRD